MAVTVAIDSMQDRGRTVIGSQRVHRGVLTFDSSYPTGGEPVTKATFDLPVALDDLHLTPAKNSTPVGYALDWDKAGGVIRAFRVGAAVATPLEEATSTVNLSAFSARFTAIGR